MSNMKLPSKAEMLMDIIKLKNENEELKQIIKNAIEYINYCLQENCEDSGDYLDNTYIGENLIFILRGEDNE